jgi:hypothetical protein
MQLASFGKFTNDLPAYAPPTLRRYGNWETAKSLIASPNMIFALAYR